MNRPAQPSNTSGAAIVTALLAAVLLACLSFAPVTALGAAASHGKGSKEESGSKGSGSKKSGPGSKGSGSKKSGPKGSDAAALWATVDVCNAPDQPDTFGIRGSMPPDGRAKEEMYMRFQVQYLSSSTKEWTDLGKGGDSGWQKLGTAAVVRQAGRTFQFVPASGEQTFTLRGLVSFQWRRAGKVMRSATKPTSPGHKSLAGADPAGFSAASCPIT